MQLTLQEPLSSRPIQHSEYGLSFRHPQDDRQDRPEGTGEAFDLPDYEPVGFEELIEDVMEFSPEMLRGIENKCSAELGPLRFAQLKQLLFRVWVGDRMI